MVQFTDLRPHNLVPEIHSSLSMPGTIPEALREAKPSRVLGVPVATGVQAFLFLELKTQLITPLSSLKESRHKDTKDKKISRIGILL